MSPHSSCCRGSGRAWAIELSEFVVEGDLVHINDKENKERGEFFCSHAVWE
jgi:hypothetical protein